MRIIWLALCLGLCLGCGHSKKPSTQTIAPIGFWSQPQVRYRPAEDQHVQGETAQLRQQTLERVPNATWDLGLALAMDELLALATQSRAVLETERVSLVLARAGFPGQARVSKTLNGGAFPEALLHAAMAREEPVDVAVSKRAYADGMVLWMVGWAPHLADINPMPRDIPLDGTVSLRVDPDRDEMVQLFVAPPDGPVEVLSLSAGATRFVDVFHTPGAYRLEVAMNRSGSSDVLLLFSIFVDGMPDEPKPLPLVESPDLDPIAAEARLYKAVNALRASHHLPAVKPFALFEGVAREHSALMASSGVVSHQIPDVTKGVASRATSVGHPRAVHHENVAAGRSVESAMALVVDSPAHLATLLCETCTHATIGVALEPVVDRPPRLFVTWELLEFPRGEPQPINHYNR